MHCLRQLCQAAKTKLDWEVVALSALSIAFGLRISEAATAAPDEAELRFKGTKGKSGLHRPKMGPWASKWGDFLARLRALSGHHPHRPAFFTSKAHLAAAFLELVQSPGCRCKTIRWHSWRKFRAAQLQALGLPLHLVQIWGLGWVGLGQGLAWSPTHGPRRLPCGTRLGGRTRVSGHKAYRTVDRPQTPRWRSRAGDAAVPVCMCPCVSEGGGGGGCGTPACSIVVRRWRTWRGEVCAWCSRPRQGGWRA